MTMFHLVSYSPLPEGRRLDAINFDSEVTNFQISDAVPGGFGGLTIGYGPFLQGQVTGRLGDPIDFVDLGHLQVYAGDERGFLVFEGRVRDIDAPIGVQAVGVTATGYGAGDMAATTDMWFAQDAFDGEPTVGGGQLLREILAAAAPLLRLGDRDAFYEPAGSYLRSGESGRYPNSVIDEVVKAGDANNKDVIFAVYEDRIATLYPRIAPVDPLTDEAIADYYVPFDRVHVQYRRSGDKLIGVVAVQYTDPTTGNADHTELSSAIEQQLFRDAHGGLLRGYLIPASNWTQAQAEFARDSYLQRHKNPVVTASIAADASWPVFNRMGGAIPFYMVRSGGWIAVGDQPPLMVTSTRKDLMRNTCQIVASNV